MSNILNMEPELLAKWIESNFIKEIPISLETADDLKNAGLLLGKLTNIYAYLMSLSTYAKLMVKEEKRKGSKKEDVDKCISRRDIIDDHVSIIKMQYNAVSRMITVKKQIDDEMRMI
jgi:hypothetical protein